MRERRTRQGGRPIGSAKLGVGQILATTEAKRSRLHRYVTPSAKRAVHSRAGVQFQGSSQPSRRHEMRWLVHRRYLDKARKTVYVLQDAILSSRHLG